MPPSISCLVISKSPYFLNRMLSSLTKARTIWTHEDEVICSWNGTDEDIKKIISPSIPTFQITCYENYHFSSNMNKLAKCARNAILLLLNDDLILDPKVLDNAICHLTNHSTIGLVGGLLRFSSGLLSHAGIGKLCTSSPDM